ncbi:MAG: hypothetical protein GX446_04765 [Chthonomonadales bacterium]|nr:hypothetical protein [Chthonomonadales bacterium]
MILPRDIELEIEEGERYLDDDQMDLARAKFRLALSLLGRMVNHARMAGKVGGPLAGVTLAEIVDALMGGVDHPLLNVILGGALGYAGGSKAAEVFDAAMAPLWLRVYQGMGDVEHRTGNDAEARKYYGMALRFMPDDPVIMARMAAVT